MQAAGFMVRRWTTQWRRLWPTGRNADDFKRDSKLAFYSVLWKQHVYSLHCPGWGCWRSIADGAGQLHGGKGWAVLLAKYMRQKRRTILQPDRKSEGSGVGHHVKHKQQATLECHLLNLTIFVVDLIRSELVWHFWLNSVLVFILSLQKNTSRVSLSVLFCFLI